MQSSNSTKPEFHDPHEIYALRSDVGVIQLLETILFKLAQADALAIVLSPEDDSNFFNLQALISESRYLAKKAFDLTYDKKHVKTQ